MVGKKDYTRLDETFEMAFLHLRRLLFAKDKMKSVLPLKVDDYYALTDENISFIDQFIYRFTKLQDLMGNRMIKQVLDKLAEPIEGKSFIDLLHRSEKLGLIDSVEDWLMLREIRNQLAHEYPSALAERLDGVNLLVEKADVLEDILHRCKSLVG